MSLTYQEYLPSPVLDKIVDVYWYNAFDGDEDQYCELQHCLPFGMAELIIHLNQNCSEGLLNGEWIPFPEACLVGIMEGPVVWRMRGNTALFGIRLKPESIYQLFGLPIKELVNTFIDADYFMNKGITSIIENVQKGPDNPMRIFFMEAFLLNQIHRFDKADNRFSEALNIIRNTNFVHSVDGLSRAVYTSERQLQRVFKDNFGVGPKSYAQIMRFRKIYRLLKNNPGVSCNDIVYNFGYADQSHFIRDFKSFSGWTPKGMLLS